MSGLELFMGITVTILACFGIVLCIFGAFVLWEEWRDLRTHRKNPQRCSFCGGKLSDIRVSNGRRYRYCFGCFHEYEVK